METKGKVLILKKEIPKSEKVTLSTVIAQIPVKVSKPRSHKAKPKPQPALALDPIGDPINTFPIGKIFTYEGRKWKKAGILPDATCRCQLVVERDGGLFTDGSITITLDPSTLVLP